MAYRRNQNAQNARIALVIFGIAAFVILLSLGIANANTSIIVTACIVPVITLAGATANTRRARSRPRDNTGRITGRHSDHRGDWHPTYNTRQYMLRRDRREARLRRQGRDTEADADAEETDKRTWKKDSRNI